MSDPELQLVLEYIRYLKAERNLSPLTLRNYEGDISHFLRYLNSVDGTGPLEVNRQVFRRYLAALRGEGIGDGSVARKVSTIHSFYRYVVRAGRLADDPLAGVRPPKQKRRLPVVLSSKQIDSVIQSADGDSPRELRDRAILELMYAGGIRLSELVGLNIRSLDLIERTARIWGKGRKERIVPLGRSAAAALKCYMENGRGYLAKETTGEALFLNRSGGRLSRRSVELLVRKYAMKAGLDLKVFPHLLRHTFATHMLDGGADLRVVQELMGHASVSSTQIYLHVTEEQQRRVYEQAFYKQVRLKSRKEVER